MKQRFCQHCGHRLRSQESYSFYDLSKKAQTKALFDLHKDIVSIQSHFEGYFEEAKEELKDLGILIDNIYYSDSINGRCRVLFDFVGLTYDVLEPIPLLHERLGRIEGDYTEEDYMNSLICNGKINSYGVAEAYISEGDIHADNSPTWRKSFLKRLETYVERKMQEVSEKCTYLIEDVYLEEGHLIEMMDGVEFDENGNAL